MDTHGKILSVGIQGVSGYKFPLLLSVEELIRLSGTSWNKQGSYLQLLSSREELCGIVRHGDKDSRMEIIGQLCHVMALVSRYFYLLTWWHHKPCVLIIQGICLV